MARRHAPELLDQLDQAAAFDALLRDLTARRDDARRHVNELSARVAQLRRAGDEEKAELVMADSRAEGELVAGAQRRGVGGRAGPARRAATHPEPPLGARAGRRGRGRQPGGEGSREPPRDLRRRTSGCRTGRPAQRSASSTPSGPPRSAGRCSRCCAGPAPRSARALCQLALDRNADAFEEIRPPTLVTHRHAHRHRPAAEVRRRRVRHRARRPLVHPHRRGAAHVDRRRRDPRRGRPPAAVHGRTRRATGARPASAGRDTRGLLRVARVRQGRDPGLRHARAGARRCWTTCWREPRARIAALGLPYRIIEICTGDLGQSHHRSFDIEVYAPGCDAWLEVSSVSWFSDYQARRADIRYRPTGAEGHRVRPHPERLRARRAPGVGGDRRERPAARRQCGPARGRCGRTCRGTEGDRRLPDARERSARRVAARRRSRRAEPISSCTDGPTTRGARPRRPGRRPVHAVVGLVRAARAMPASRSRTR